MLRKLSKEEEKNYFLASKRCCKHCYFYWNNWTEKAKKLNPQRYNYCCILHQEVNASFTCNVWQPK